MITVFTGSHYCVWFQYILTLHHYNSMAYNLRSRLTSEGSSVAPRSEGMNLSPVELAVPMSEQTQITAGHGLDLLGPVIIEGSPEAL